jgi:hypothetical protein
VPQNWIQQGLSTQRLVWVGIIARHTGYKPIPNEPPLQSVILEGIIDAGVYLTNPILLSQTDFNEHHPANQVLFSPLPDRQNITSHLAN